MLLLKAINLTSGHAYFLKVGTWSLWGGGVVGMD